MHMHYIVAAGSPTALAKLWPIGSMIQCGHGLGVHSVVCQVQKLATFSFKVQCSQGLLHGVDNTVQLNAR